MRIWKLTAGDVLLDCRRWWNSGPEDDIRLPLSAAAMRKGVYRALQKRKKEGDPHVLTGTRRPILPVPIRDTP